ncbi:MAG: peptidoglycan-associated lipoprotein [Desulfuromonas sp.]|nr:MAG: peptidoglycan-associated lipoprotein [Desulfuromonas sp.]
MFWLLLVVLTLALAPGCAKKPATGGNEEQPVVTNVSDKDVSGVDQSGMSGSGVTDRTGQDAGLQAASAALNRIHFAFDQFSLSGEARRTLTANADYLRANPGIKVKIEGHCDERGSDEYNLALGERRAQATKDYLASLGISSSRLMTISYGEEKPLDPASNEAAWAKNRRAEFSPAR